MNEVPQEPNKREVDPSRFEDACFMARAALKPIGEQVMALMDHAIFRGAQNGPRPHSEMKANVMLAYRHIEDARMRLGKAVQAYDGGTSCYPR